MYFQKLIENMFLKNWINRFLYYPPTLAFSLYIFLKSTSTIPIYEVYYRFLDNFFHNLDAPKVSGGRRPHEYAINQDG